MQVSESEDQSSLQKQVSCSSASNHYSFYSYVKMSCSQPNTILVQKIREHEEEIMQLHRHLTQYSVKVSAFVDSPFKTLSTLLDTFSLLVEPIA